MYNFTRFYTNSHFNLLLHVLSGAMHVAYTFLLCPCAWGSAPTKRVAEAAAQTSVALCHDGVLLLNSPLSIDLLMFPKATVLQHLLAISLPFL